MPLGLINVYSTRNLGDAAILEALTSLSRDGRAYARVPDHQPIAIRGLTPVSRMPRVDGYVSVGGDIFNNGRPKFVSRRFIANIGELMPRAHRTIVFGQSIPRSCRGAAFSILAKAFQRVAGVMVRDVESYRRLVAAGVRVELGHDAAFALSLNADAGSRGRALLASFGVCPERAAIVSLRGFDEMYPIDQAGFTERMAALCRNLMARGHQAVVLVQADADGSDSDRAISAELVSRAPGLVVLDLFSHCQDPLHSLMDVLAAAEIVVAVRYHTAVLRLLSGRVPVVLSYSNKTRDLCDRLQLPGDEAATFDPSEVVRLAESAAARPFDPNPLGRLVRDLFGNAIAKAELA